MIGAPRPFANRAAAGPAGTAATRAASRLDTLRRPSEHPHVVKVAGPAITAPAAETVSTRSGSRPNGAEAATQVTRRRLGGVIGICPAADWRLSRSEGRG